MREGKLVVGEQPLLLHASASGVPLTAPSAFHSKLQLNGLTRHTHAPTNAALRAQPMQVRARININGRKFLKNARCSVKPTRSTRCTQAERERDTHTPTPESSSLGGPPAQIRRACFPRVK